MNKLADATSPYLLQHADNPVDWFEWGDEAFECARADDKPLLVSVGYSSCHWCHVMAHESFESPTTAALMNELFVNVKVDREERPDVDAVTMAAAVGMTGSGGWPTTVFMTPDAKPFYAGTYFPPEPRHGIASFPELLRAVSEAWRARRGDLERQAERIDAALRSTSFVEPSPEPLDASVLEEAARAVALTFEPAFGGFGRAPKFPAASTLEFLLRRGDEESLAMVTATLDGMAAGGLYDVVGGGFHRYSVDDRWLVPHFEKMLYDNAVLASTYLHAWVVTGRERYREVVEHTLEYVLRELALPGGGLASAQDADTHGVEGLTYTWTPEEADEVGLPRDLLEPFEHGRLIVRGELEPELRRSVLAARLTRPQPFRDDKALAAWNGLTLAALAEAGYRLEQADWLDAARGLGEFLLGPLSAQDGQLLRSTRDGRSSGAGFLDDYANAPAACSSCMRRPASFGGCSRHAGSPCSRSSSSQTRSTGASSSRRRRATCASHARRTCRTRRSRPGARCSRTSSCVSLASGGTTSSSGTPSPSFASSSRSSAPHPASSPGCCAGSTCG